MNKPFRVRSYEGESCRVPECKIRPTSDWLCSSHYSRKETLGWDESRLTEEFQKRNPGSWAEWRKNVNGYVYRYRKNENGKREVQFQHRLVMSEMIGRQLLNHETPHHINGDRADNRPENLELWSHSQPAGQRVEDKLAWAHEIIKIYEPKGA